MSRKILCEACGSVLNEEFLKQKNSENTCPVCGASLGMEESESASAPEEELVAWYYIEFKNSTSYFIIEKSKIKMDKITSDMEIKYTFQAPPKDNKNGSEAAKEVLRREYKPDAFLEPTKIENPEPIVRCPHCGSTNIQLVPRKFSIWTGFRTNKVDRICVNCKHRF